MLNIQDNKKEVLQIIKDALLKGKVVVLPTDTVYGLVCDARNDESVKRIFKIKKKTAR